VEVSKKLISFSFDGVTIFIGVHIGVTTQICEKVAPFMLIVHYVAHQTNMVMQTLSNQPLVQNLKRLLQSIYTYFFFSPKKDLE
jgi:hypothetical protein